MKQSLKDYLVSRSADSDMIQQAARYYVNERNDYPSPEDMYNQLLKGSDDIITVNQALNVLKTDNVALEDASLTILSYAWEELGETEEVKGAIEAAKNKFPIIDPGTLAIVAMFGLMYIAWLAQTGGKEVDTTEEEHDSDGSSKKKATTKYYPSPLSMLADLNISKIFGKKDSNEQDSTE